MATAVYSNGEALGQLLIVSTMAVNPTVILTFFLLFLMMGAGLFSGTWGYSLGRQALRGITQPDSRPGSPVSRSEPDTKASGEGMVFLDEAKLIEDVKAQMSGTPATPTSTPSDASSAVPSSDTAATPVVATETAVDSVSLDSESTLEPVTDEFASEESEDPNLESAAWEPTDPEISEESWQPDDAYLDEGTAESEPFAQAEPFLDTESN